MTSRQLMRLMVALWDRRRGWAEGMDGFMCDDENSSQSWRIILSSGWFCWTNTSCSRSEHVWIHSSQFSYLILCSHYSSPGFTDIVYFLEWWEFLWSGSFFLEQCSGNAVEFISTVVGSCFGKICHERKQSDSSIDPFVIDGRLLP